jgi:hypothetical protein
MFPLDKWIDAALDPFAAAGAGGCWSTTILGDPALRLAPSLNGQQGRNGNRLSLETKVAGNRTRVEGSLGGWWVSPRSRTPMLTMEHAGSVEGRWREPVGDDAEEMVDSPDRSSPECLHSLLTPS